MFAKKKISFTENRSKH